MTYIPQKTQTLIITSNTTITGGSNYLSFVLNPNTSSPYGELVATLPASGSGTVGNTFRFVHGTNPGKCKIDANGSQKILYRNK